MSLVWRCDRCHAVSLNGLPDEAPAEWETRSMPVRGSTGARSSSDVTLCGECDDSLYAWLHKAHKDRVKEGSGE